MFTLGVLDVCIGLIFVYLLLAMLCTVVNEWLAGVRGWRGEMLERALDKLLGPHKDAFFNHPLIKALASEPSWGARTIGRRTKARPSYIPAKTFAKAFASVSAAAGEEKGRARGEARVTAAPAEMALEALKDEAKEKAKPVEESMAAWFDEVMERVSGQYKRKLQGVTFVVAALVTIFANADTFDIFNRLWANPALRAAVVEEAKVRAQKSPPLNVDYPNPDSPEPSEPVITPPLPEEAYELSNKERELLGQLVGWSHERGLWAARKAELHGNWLTYPAKYLWARVGWFGRAAKEHFLGWLLTAVAVSLGAPFWFDMLNKVINLRSTGGKPKTPGDGSASGDRRGKKGKE